MDFDKCVPYFNEHMGCGICLAACPWSQPGADTPVFAQADMSRLQDDIARLEGLEIALVIIDTPPAITSMIERVVVLSHVVAIPTRPSPHDPARRRGYGGYR